jgi:hypothetical protein
LQEQQSTRLRLNQKRSFTICVISTTGNVRLKCKLRYYPTMSIQERRTNKNKNKRRRRANICDLTFEVVEGITEKEYNVGEMANIVNFTIVHVVKGNPHVMKQKATRQIRPESRNSWQLTWLLTTFWKSDLLIG